MSGPGLALPADAQVFLGRLARLDPAALVRLRPVRPAAPEGTAPAGSAGPGRTALWARLPWGVLVTREIAAAGLAGLGDRTVGAAALLAEGPARSRDAEWRWPLPPPASTVVEEIPAPTLREVAVAAAGTLREVTETGLAGRPVGVRMLREALLDHVPIVVTAATGVTAATVATAATERVEVPQRLVQAVVQMGFLGDPPAGEGGAGEAPVRVRTAGSWVGLAAWYGSAWLPPRSGPLTVRPR